MAWHGRAAHRGPWMAAAPVRGGLVIGLMARFGSEKIRRHGIPEAIEAILTGGSQMPPCRSRARSPSPSAPVARSAPKAPPS